MTPIPVSIVGGYLGAGKTTLLNAVLARARVRTAVLVNDFGSVSVDAALIARTGTQTIELTNGCTCCTIGGDLILALKRLVSDDVVPEWIVIEASGVADPRAVARLAACHPKLAVRRTVVVADGENVVERADDKYVGGLVRRQLAAADTILLSKTDRMTSARFDAVRSWIGRTVPGIPLVTSTDMTLSVETLLGARPVEPARDTGATGAGAGVGFATVTHSSATPFDRARFAHALERSTGELARVKGFVHFDDDPHEVYLLQAAGARWSLEPFARSDAPAQTQIVAIAPAARQPVLDEFIRALCEAESSRREDATNVHCL